MNQNQTPPAASEPVQFFEIAPESEAYRKAVKRMERAKARALRTAIREAYADVAA